MDVRGSFRPCLQISVWGHQPACCCLRVLLLLLSPCRINFVFLRPQDKVISLLPAEHQAARSRRHQQMEELIERGAGEALPAGLRSRAGCCTCDLQPRRLPLQATDAAPLHLLSGGSGPCSARANVPGRYLCLYAWEISHLLHRCLPAPTLPTPLPAARISTRSGAGAGARGGGGAWIRRNGSSYSAAGGQPVHQPHAAAAAAAAASSRPAGQPAAAAAAQSGEQLGCASAA